MELQCTPFKRGPTPDRPADPARGLREVLGGWPITSYFGPRIDPIKGGPGNHGGMDQGIPYGEPFYAVYEGPFTGLLPSASGGGGIWGINMHPSGARFCYGHMIEFALGVLGRKVYPGDVIGYCDSTGNSTGNHIHEAYDSEDSNTWYDDPYPVVYNAVKNGLFPGSLSQGGEDVMDDAQMKHIDSEFARVHTHLDQIDQANLNILTAVKPLEYIDDWENDTRNILAGISRTAGRASRPFPFRINNGPEVWVLCFTEEGIVKMRVPGGSDGAEFSESLLALIDVGAINDDQSINVVDPERVAFLNAVREVPWKQGR